MMVVLHLKAKIDGTSMLSRDCVSFRFLSIYGALFLAPMGRYRLVVFVVSPQNFVTAKGVISRDKVLEWLSGGSVSLDEVFRNIKFDDTFRITALIYEFYASGRSEEPRLERPSTLSGDQHLAGAHLWPPPF
jgi:hypothetical protein